MKIVSIEHRYRDIGISTGQPCFFVRFGPGASMDPLDLTQKLVRMGLTFHRWVIIQGDFDKEQQIGTFIDSIKTYKSRCEVELKKDYPGTPMWFTRPARWVVYWSPGCRFNYEALRPMQDMVIYDGSDLDSFFIASKEWICMKAIITDNPDAIWDQVKFTDARVYKRC